MPAIAKLQASGAVTLRQIAAGLNAAEISTPRGRGEWSAFQVQRILKAVAQRKPPITEIAIAKEAFA